MSNVLFDVSTEREKLPTLREFLKHRGKRKIASVYPVYVVWRPGKYPNIVFETDSFRAIIYKGNEVYEAVSGQLDTLVFESPGLGIKPDIDNPGKFSIVSLPNESPAIDPIGEYGYRFVY